MFIALDDCLPTIIKLFIISATLTSINTRCVYQQQGVRDYAAVNFICPSPGLVGKVITLQNLNGGYYYFETVEIEVLGEYIVLNDSRDSGNNFFGYPN